MSHDATRTPSGRVSYSGTVSQRVPGIFLSRPARRASVQNRSTGVIYVAPNRSAQQIDKDELDAGDSRDFDFDVSQIDIIVPTGTREWTADFDF